MVGPQVVQDELHQLSLSIHPTVQSRSHRLNKRTASPHQLLLQTQLVDELLVIHLEEAAPVQRLQAGEDSTELARQTLGSDFLNVAVTEF